MSRDLSATVWRRAGGCCEYCRMPQQFDRLPLQIDHIIAVSHGGPTTAANLCLYCSLCNLYKGPNLSGIDPRGKQVKLLFHPRRQKWPSHFRWDGPLLMGRTAAGRATVATLRINLPDRVAHRQALIEEGVFPPD